jgi:hypothetical protein
MRVRFSQAGSGTRACRVRFEPLGRHFCRHSVSRVPHGANFFVLLLPKHDELHDLQSGSGTRKFPESRNPGRRDARRTMGRQEASRERSDPSRSGRIANERNRSNVTCDGSGTARARRNASMRIAERSCDWRERQLQQRHLRSGGRQKLSHFLQPRLSQISANRGQVKMIPLDGLACGIGNVPRRNQF